MARTILRSKRSRDGQVASVWENMGMLEETVYQREEQWAGEVQKFKDMEASLASAGLRCFNKPNLLKQNFWMQNSALGRNVVYGDDSRWAATSSPYLSSYNRPTEYTQTTEPTAAELAECCAYYTTTDDGVTTYHLYKDEDDIKATVADLAAADQITELDGDVYSKAIQYAITANTAWGNAEWLMYYRSQTNKYKQGESCREYGQIPEMIPGEKYTVSVWARVISGDGALIRFAWGGTHNNTPFNQEGKCVVSDPIEVKGSAWARYSWTFTFNPQGDWYTETSEDVEGVTWITRNYNWNKRVAFGVLRKWNSVIQLTGFRLVAGRMWVTDTWDDIGDKIDQYTGTIDQLATDMAAKADKDNTELTGSISMGRAAESIVGTSSVAIGQDVVASSPYAHAEGRDTVAKNGSGAHAEGRSTTAEGDYAHAEGRGTAAKEAYSHAEGRDTVADGIASHAEGIGTIAPIIGGRAAGMYNAVSFMSNVQEYAMSLTDQEYTAGTYVKVTESYDVIDPDTEEIVDSETIITIWRCRVTHVPVLEYPDPDKWIEIASYHQGDYANPPMDFLEAIGNGTGDGARSNARTLDRDGNETLAGKLTLGAAPAGDMDAATKAYVDGAGPVIMVNLGTVDLGNGSVRFYPPFAAHRYRPAELVLSNTDGISAVTVKTGKTTAEYINLNATITYTPGVTYNYSKDVTIKLEKIEKTYTLDGSAWSEADVNGATVDFTY